MLKKVLDLYLLTLVACERIKVLMSELKLSTLYDGSCCSDGFIPVLTLTFTFPCFLLPHHLDVDKTGTFLNGGRQRKSEFG